MFYLSRVSICLHLAAVREEQFHLQACKRCSTAITIGTSLTGSALSKETGRLEFSYLSPEGISSFPTTQGGDVSSVPTLPEFDVNSIPTPPAGDVSSVPSRQEAT